jgi:ceramide glucosyltransferase
LLFTQGLPWSLAAAALAPSRLFAIGYLSAYLVTRLAMAFAHGAYGMKDPLLRRKWWLMPLRDAMGFFIWLATLFYDHVWWRGSKFYLRRGHLVPVAPPVGTEPKRARDVL